MSTKTRIVETATSLFNELGISAVSIRDITAEMGISPGNFTYYFKNKNEVLAYYFNHYYDEQEMLNLPGKNEGLEQLQNGLEKALDFITENRFCFIDPVEVFRLYPGMQDRFTQAHKRRVEAYVKMLLNFEKMKLIKKQAEAVEFKNLAETIWILLSYWPIQIQVHPAGSVETKPRYLFQKIWGLIMPYFTRQGVMQYESMRRK